MRFMMIVRATDESESGAMPSAELVSAMGRYNDDLTKAGVLLDSGGLRASSHGARITFTGQERTVTNGPFGNAKELIAGYWVIQVKSRDEAIEWAKRIPFHPPHDEPGAVVELRQFHEMEDFPS